MGRGQAAMQAGFETVLQRLPFPLLQLHPDNGSEFFSAHLLRFFGEQITGLRLTRSRPYQKNDNPHVEQKNDTLVRAYFGHSRLETGAQLEVINECYELMWTYYNLFQPVMKLLEKRFENGRLRRVWDEPKTAYHRLKEKGVLDREVEQRLDELYERTNPRQLRQRIYELRDRLWEPAATRQAA